MTEEIEIADVVAEDLPDETKEWFRESKLAGDPWTAVVVECLRDVRAASGMTLEPDIIGAILAAYFHRATDMARTPEGEPIEAPEDIPGELHSMDLAVLRGFRSLAAHREHCSDVEERASAAMLNMATRWAEGKEAYKWTFEVIDDCYGEGAYSSRQRRALEDMQGTFVG